MDFDMRMQVWVTISLMAMLAGFPVQAQENQEDGPLSQINACRKISDPALRVSCYDSAVDGLNTAVAKKEVTIVDKATVKEAKRGLFGFSFSNIKLFGGGNKDEQEAPEERTLTAKVASAREFGYGLWRFKLETGAVWETTEPLKGIRPPKVGEEATLEKGVLGSYFATFGKGVRTRAKRVN
jgi:hypothetical protein